jgi:hypothetical protein
VRAAEEAEMVLAEEAALMAEALVDVALATTITTRLREFCNFLPELELQVTTVTASCTIDRVNKNNMVPQV